MQNSAVVPASAGITLPPENLGKVRNKGFEFTVGYNDIFGDFRFGVSVNGGYAKNEVINLPETPFGPIKFDEHGQNPHQVLITQVLGGQYKVVYPPEAAETTPVVPTPSWDSRQVR